MKRPRLPIGAALIALAIIFHALAGRYEISSPNERVRYRIDRLTGDIETCPTTTNRANDTASRRYEIPNWCKPLRHR